MREALLGEREVLLARVAPAQMPAIPSWTTEGAFGIARTTGTPAAIRLSIREVRMAAATERTVCSGESCGPISPRIAPVQGDSSEGFSTTVLPAISAALSMLTASATGKLNGEMTAKTP